MPEATFHASDAAFGTDAEEIPVPVRAGLPKRYQRFPASTGLATELRFLAGSARPELVITDASDLGDAQDGGRSFDLLLDIYATFGHHLRPHPREVQAMSAAVEAYLAALPPDQREALTTLRARLKTLLPDHVETMSYAMPGLRQPGPRGKMVVGYAAFARHLGLYPHSGTVIPLIDCALFRASTSGVLFSPDQPLPDALLERILRARQAELAAGYGAH